MTRKELISSPEYWNADIRMEVRDLIIIHQVNNDLSDLQMAEKLSMFSQHLRQILNLDSDEKLSKIVEIAVALGKVPKVEFIDIDDFLQNKKMTELLIPTTELNKANLAILADKTVQDAIETRNVLEMAEQLAGLLHTADLIRQDPRFIDAVRDELAKNAGKITTPSGAKIETVEAGVKYDFSDNWDWRILNNQVDTAIRNRKWCEDKLKTIAPGKYIVDQETGEVTEGAGKSSKSTYRIILKSK